MSASRIWRWWRKRRDRCRACKGTGYLTVPANSDYCCEACGTSGKASYRPGAAHLTQLPSRSATKRKDFPTPSSP